MSSEASPSSSSPCGEWFGKYRKYILVSLGAGLILALILALGLTLTTDSANTKGFLIAGGGDEPWGEQKVEIFIPAFDKTCPLENLPDTLREDVSMCGGLLCGGWRGHPDSDYCLKWDSETGTFSGTQVERSIGPYHGLSCWDLGDRGVLIMGRTTNLVSVNGLTSSPSFPLQHEIVYRCGIDLGESYVLTGGLMWTGSEWEKSSKVSFYSTTGWTEDLPDLKIARSHHACSFYTTDSGDNVLMITGGKSTTTDDGMASTEIYRNNVWSVLPSAVLPSPTYGLSAGKIDDTIFLLGGKPTVGILRFNSRTEKWEEVGSFQRYGFAMQVVDNAEKYCSS